MCENILIIFKDPAKEPVWVTTKGELFGYCQKGLWDSADQLINLKKELVITDGEQKGDIITESETCLCGVSHQQTAFRNGFIYSRLNMEYKNDPMDGYYREYL
jgi:hypothetical protein